MPSVRSMPAPLAVAITLVSLLGLFLGALGGVPWPASAQQTERAQLSEARQRLAEIADRIEAAESDHQRAEDALADADETLAEIEGVVNEVTLAVERQRDAVRDAERRLAQVEADAGQLEEDFEQRIARLYKQGPELSFELLLSSADADQAIARTVLLERLTEGDSVDLERLAAAQVAVDSERERFAREQELLEVQLAEQEDVLAEAQALREAKALAAADARARAQDLTAQHDDLEADAARLEDAIQAHEKRQAEARRAAAAASSRTGSVGRASASGFAWPMCAPITSGYGPRWGRMHRGVDQGASSGTPIRAVKAGTVISAGWQGGYGNLTLVDHGGVVSAYAHQSRLAVGAGTRVSQGQVLGYVGSTGNSTGPHLHLEIRVNGGSVNPRQYLPGSPC